MKNEGGFRRKEGTLDLRTEKRETKTRQQDRLFHFDLLTVFSLSPRDRGGSHRINSHTEKAGDNNAYCRRADDSNPDPCNDCRLDVNGRSDRSARQLFEKKQRPILPEIKSR